MPGVYNENLRKAEEMKWAGSMNSSDHPFQPLRRYPVHEDAFSTLMMWLHGKMNATR
jgi:hypothetical protein